MLLTFEQWIWKVHRLNWRRFDRKDNVTKDMIRKDYEDFTKGVKRGDIDGV